MKFTARIILIQAPSDDSLMIQLSVQILQRKKARVFMFARISKGVNRTPNGATFEWIEHERVELNARLTATQLYVARETEAPLLWESVVSTVDGGIGICGMFEKRLYGLRCCEVQAENEGDELGWTEGRFACGGVGSGDTRSTVKVCGGATSCYGSLVWRGEEW